MVRKSPKYDEIVEEDVAGGPPRTVGYVKGGKVYEPVMGGSDRVVGYVEGGRAYEIVMGGPPRVLGRVRRSGRNNL